MATERTFIMIKPDGVARNLVAKIIERFEQRGYKLVAMKFMQAGTDLLNQHYADLKEKPFFPSLVKHIASGPVVPMVWEGKDVVRQGRVLLGETDPLKSKPGSIRGDFSIDMGRNIIHGSDSVESALKEIGLWFNVEELVDWSHPLHSATYEYSITNLYNNLVTMASFGDLSTSSGLKALNDHLATRSYIEGYVPCQADVSIFSSLASTPSAEYCHLARWYRHIKSFSAKEQESFPGVPESTQAPAPAAAKGDDDDDDFDIFGDDDEEEEETEEEKKIKEERLAAYHAKKATKQAVIAKSSLLLDVKPWDDETDMAKMEECVRTIECDGLVWGQSKLVPLAYGIKKLQICAVIEDDKVSTDWLDEEITKFSDYVQSMDIAKFNKI